MPPPGKIIKVAMKGLVQNIEGLALRNDEFRRVRSDAETDNEYLDGQNDGIAAG